MKQVIFNRDQLSALSEQLETLFDSAAAPAAFRWPLIDLWFSNHSEFEPIAILIWREKILVATAVLSAKQCFGSYVISKAGVSGEPYALIALDEEAGKSLVVAIDETLRSMNRPWVMWLNDLPTSDLTVTALIEKLKYKKVYDSIQSPQIWFEVGSDINKYISKNTRSAIAKARNKITNDNLAMDLCWLTRSSEIEQCLDEIVVVHRERNRAKRGRAVLDDIREEQFFKQTVITYANLEKIKVLVIRLNGSLAAFSICVVDREMLWVYSNMVSPDWSAYSAGTIANAEVVKMAHSDPAIKAVNWGAGLQRYKLSGNSIVVPSIGVSAWSSVFSRLFWRLVHLLGKLNFNFMSSCLSFSFIKSINFIQNIEYIELIL